MNDRRQKQKRADKKQRRRQFCADISDEVRKDHQQKDTGNPDKQISF